MEKREFDDIGELLSTLSPYISARALARICNMSENQMLQYKAGIKKISPQNIPVQSDFGIRLSRVSAFVMRILSNRAG